MVYGLGYGSLAIGYAYAASFNSQPMASLIHWLIARSHRQESMAIEAIGTFFSLSEEHPQATCTDI